MIQAKQGRAERMDIGLKIKNARTAAKLTQEQAAEALGVSRQTISNWENQKTYPDIVSVIKMSDLYDISLDHLLKEEKPMSNYMDYLEESTNVVKSKDRMAKLILILTGMGIWAVSLIVFWFFTDGSDAMGYSLMFLWVLLPMTIFVISLLIGKMIIGERKNGEPSLSAESCICLPSMRHSERRIWYHGIRSICRIWWEF